MGEKESVINEETNEANVVEKIAESNVVENEFVAEKMSGLSVVGNKVVAEKMSESSVIENETVVEKIPEPSVVENEAVVEKMPEPSVIENETVVEKMPEPSVIENETVVEKIVVENKKQEGVFESKETITHFEQTVSQTNDFNKKKPIKKVILYIIIVLVISLLSIFLAVFLLLNVQYNNAGKAFDNKKYYEAISKYEKISWYNDVEEKLNKSYIEYGVELMNSDDCTNALKYFDKAKIDENDEKVKYCNLFLLNYDNFKKAEEYYKDGKLSAAKEIYSKLDSSFKYHDVSVADRLSTLKTYDKFVKLSGTKSGSGKMEVKHIYKRDGSSEWWNAKYTSSSEVKCQILEDGSVKISVIAKFYSFSKYSTLSYALGEKEYSAYYTVTVKKGGSIPKKFGTFPAAIAPSGTVGNATLTYSDNKLVLNFVLDDKNYSQYFRNKYTSKITYK